MTTAIDIQINPPELETWDLVPPSTVGALDLLALILAEHTGWRVRVELDNGVSLTAAPATTTNGDTE